MVYVLMAAWIANVRSNAEAQTTAFLPTLEERRGGGRGDLAEARGEEELRRSAKLLLAGSIVSEEPQTSLVNPPAL